MQSDFEDVSRSRKGSCVFIQYPEWSEKTRLSMATADEPGHTNEGKLRGKKEGNIGTIQGVRTADRGIFKTYGGSRDLTCSCSFRIEFTNFENSGKFRNSVEMPLRHTTPSSDEAVSGFSCFFR